ncbi:Transmembrane amino acid transporter family protein [Prunus dulcis]|uniref:Transmembrane amino acid transporter family protein n=1 Tax=Prunus dulcis TaxID=3755 RepID=A0A4Y1RBX3_PRUDU|nr:Transmembrane amino acid transporter family protein [Prunus dulcis]
MSAGLVTLPYALSRGGWLSLVLLFLISIITFYTAILLKKCMDSDPSITSYLDIAERAFGKTARIVVLIILSTELYLVAVGLIILESDSLYKLFPKFRIKLGSLFICGRQSFVLVTALITLPTMLITEMSILSYVSATGVFCCLIIVGSIVCVGAFGGHAITPSIYISMRDKNQFSKLSTRNHHLHGNRSHRLSYVWRRCRITDHFESTNNRSECKSCNIHHSTYSNRKICVDGNPVANAIEGGLPEDYKNWRSVKLLIRMALLVSSTVVAYVFPYYETLMAIVGSLFTVSVSFILPCMCYLKLSACYRSGNYKLLGSVGIIAFGTLVGVLGTYSSIVELVQEY